MGDQITKSFRPFAAYDEFLDRVIVMTRDRSSTEVRINGILSIFEDNYPSEGENRYVGFEISHCRRFCMIHKREYRGRIDLRELLEDIAMIHSCPSNFKTEIDRILLLVDAVELPS